jgi:hypothetical protein
MLNDPANDPYDDTYQLKAWAKTMTTAQLEYGIQRSQKHLYSDKEVQAVRDELASREGN